MEALDLIIKLLKDRGYMVKAESTADGTRGSIEVHQMYYICDDGDGKGGSIKPYFRFMTINVEGAKLTCKCDGIPPGEVSSEFIDLHDPASLDRFSELLDLYEKQTKGNMDSTLLRMLAHGRLWDV